MISIGEATVGEGVSSIRMVGKGVASMGTLGCDPFAVGEFVAVTGEPVIVGAVGKAVETTGVLMGKAVAATGEAIGDNVEASMGRLGDVTGAVGKTGETGDGCAMGDNDVWELQ